MTHPRAGIWLALVFSILAVELCASPSRETPPATPTPAAAAGSAYPMTVTDDGGTAVTLLSPPRRIVSLTLFTDEVLLDLVGPDRLVAVTTFAPDPAVSNVADRVAAIPNRLTLAVEPVLAMNADLVFVADWSDAATVKQLRDVGETVYVSAPAADIPAVERKIRGVAVLVGEAAKGDAMVAEMEKRLAEVARRLTALRPEQRLSVVDYALWGSAMGKGSSWDDVVSAAGLRNAVGGLEVDAYGQVPLSKEKLVELDPDVVILPGWVYGDPKGADTFAAQVRSDPALAGLKAIREGRTFQMPERLKSTVSQYIVDAVEYLARTAYPDLFR